MDVEITDEPLIFWFWVGCAAIPIAMWAAGELASLGLLTYVQGIAAALSTWLSVHDYVRAAIIFLIAYIINRIIDAIIDWIRNLIISAHEKPSEEDVVLLARAISKYMEGAGIEESEVNNITRNPDGTYTVTFSDGSRQTFKKVGDDFAPVPTPSDDPPPTNNDSSSGTSGGLGTGDYAPREPNQYY